MPHVARIAAEGLELLDELEATIQPLLALWAQLTEQLAEVDAELVNHDKGLQVEEVRRLQREALCSRYGPPKK